MTLYDFIYYVFYCVKPELIWCWLMLWCICMLWFRLRNLQGEATLIWFQPFSLTQSPTLSPVKCWHLNHSRDAKRDGQNVELSALDAIKASIDPVYLGSYLSLRTRRGFIPSSIILKCLV